MYSVVALLLSAIMAIGVQFNLHACAAISAAMSLCLAVHFAIHIALKKRFPVHQKGGVLVTGASTGIGHDAALGLAQAGFEVYAGVRKQADADAFRAANLSNLHPTIIDVTKEDTIISAQKQITKDLAQKGLPFVGLVNNAGITYNQAVEFINLSTMRQLYEVNIFGVVAVTQAFIPMLRASQGRIIAVGSITGVMARPLNGPYCSSKHALEGLMDSLRGQCLLGCSHTKRPRSSDLLAAVSIPNSHMVTCWGHLARHLRDLVRGEMSMFNISVSLIEPGNIATDMWSDRKADAIYGQRELDAGSSAIYGDVFTKREKAIKKLVTGKGAHPRDSTTPAILDALTNAAPKTRYVPGPAGPLPAWLWLSIWAWLPDRLRDILLKTMG